MSTTLRSRGATSRDGHGDTNGRVAAAAATGERAPDFSLALVSEVGTVSLRDYLGRAPVLLVLLRYIW